MRENLKNNKDERIVHSLVFLVLVAYLWILGGSASLNQRVLSLVPKAFWRFLHKANDVLPWVVKEAHQEVLVWHLSYAVDFVIEGDTLLFELVYVYR